MQGSANAELFEGLLMLQHRGQDSAGMVTYDGHRFCEHKDNGLVNDVFGAKTMKQLRGWEPYSPPCSRTPVASPKSMVRPPTIHGQGRWLCPMSHSQCCLTAAFETVIDQAQHRPRHPYRWPRGGVSPPLQSLTHSDPCAYTARACATSACSSPHLLDCLFAPQSLQMLRRAVLLLHAGHSGIGHVRYPTAGSSSAQEAQPFFVNSPLGIYLIHNGNVTNTQSLRQSLEGSHSFFNRHLRTDSDSEVQPRMESSCSIAYFTALLIRHFDGIYSKKLYSGDASGNCADFSRR